MATQRSQNGYSANDRSVIRTYTVPGTKVRLPLRMGDASVVLLYVAEQFDKRVEKLHVGWCWGYAERNIRGSSTTLSNHASGTGEDLNAPEHPLGKVGTFSKAQQREIDEILAEVDGVVRWGGDYRNRKDEMHFEIVGSRAEVAAVADDIRAGKLGKGRATPGNDWAIVVDNVYKASVKCVQTGKTQPYMLSTARLQYALNRYDKRFGLWTGKPLVVDGKMGPRTVRVIKMLEKRKGLDVNGTANRKVVVEAARGNRTFAK